MHTSKIFSLLFAMSLLFESHVRAPVPAMTVYICENSKVYHSSKNCRAVANAKYKARAVSEADAIKKYGRRRCRICCW